MPLDGPDSTKACDVGGVRRVNKAAIVVSLEPVMKNSRTSKVGTALAGEGYVVQG